MNATDVGARLKQIWDANGYQDTDETNELIGMLGDEFNPNQPRDPAGSSTGGQWASAAGEYSNYTSEKLLRNYDRPAFDPTESTETMEELEKDLAFAERITENNRMSDLIRREAFAEYRRLDRRIKHLKGLK